MLKNSVLIPVYLIIAGLILIGIGAAELFIPHRFHAGAGISLGDGPDLVNEVRAAGGGLLFAGLAVGAAAIFRAMQPVGVVISTALYLGYGLARLFGFAIDGTAGQTLVIATAIEIALGAAGFVLLIRTGIARRADQWGNA